MTDWRKAILALAPGAHPDTSIDLPGKLYYGDFDSATTNVANVHQSAAT